MSSTAATKGKAALLESVQAILGSRVSERRAAQARYFAAAFLRRVPEEDFRGETPPSLAALVEGIMKFAGRREPGSHRIRAFNPEQGRDGWTSPHTIIEMVNRDQPFLVDTANLVMSELGLGVHIIVHPVSHVERDRID